MSDEVIGLQDLINNLGKLPLALGTQKNILARAGRAGGEVILEAFKQKAPRSDEAPHAADSGVVVVSDQTADGCIVKVGPSKKGFYLTFQEFGTAHHSAQPSLRPAFDEKQEEAKRVVGEVIGREIESEMAKR